MRTTLHIFGAEGCGKSSIANLILKHVLKSEESFGTGIEFESSVIHYFARVKKTGLVTVMEHQIPNQEYSDINGAVEVIEGLSKQPSSREKLAATVYIDRHLKKAVEGKNIALLVISLESGRLRPMDQGVLKELIAAKQTGDYDGVFLVVNKVSTKVMEGAEGQLLGVRGEFYVGNDTDCEDEDDAPIRPECARNFLDSFDVNQEDKGVTLTVAERDPDREQGSLSGRADWESEEARAPVLLQEVLKIAFLGGVIGLALGVALVVALNPSTIALTLATVVIPTLVGASMAAGVHTLVTHTTFFGFARGQSEQGDAVSAPASKSSLVQVSLVEPETEATAQSNRPPMNATRCFC